jgi:hypothetical protein
MHERITHIILDESLFHVVKNALNEDGCEIIILERKLEICPLLAHTKKAMVKALKDICDMRLESDNLDSVGGQLF